jgi:hypothetical protein
MAVFPGNFIFGYLKFESHIISHAIKYYYSSFNLIFPKPLKTSKSIPSSKVAPKGTCAAGFGPQIARFINLAIRGRIRIQI